VEAEEVKFLLKRKQKILYCFYSLGQD